MRILFTTILLSAISVLPQVINAQSAPAKRYYNEKNIEISEAAFNRKKQSANFLEIEGDSVNSVKLTGREERGTVPSMETLYQKLENATNQKLSREKPLVIIYHPGEDPCNTSGTSTIQSSKAWYARLEKVVYNKTKTSPLYIYKSKTEPDKGEPFLPWSEDPDSLIESTFFKHHYPCGSFVVISPSGKYFSFFGEFMKEQVWEAVDKMTK